ncbi:pyridine nucleotide-disulfide oxidoreductase [Staphylococcus schleiferi subsp. coagulans]|uniref:FAD/NAD(P)-binding protein n=1 Tax=Staphylococcus coagulans TaxID=74706 RepID=UPI0015F9F7CC|nr:FAD/NAD(P)-binding protein [Staphylococcus coagulans]MBA8758731.1 pyridine nucleotide-disulfide oxidoreductase [Staphylococcus coagulans]MBA8768490.1 pyridine nucleotide-disulfide oxidoreductase [Staphylococcus coagulans]
MRVAIIGMGTAGVSVLRQLVKYKHFKKIQLDIYDNEENMGQGKPFQNDSEDLLINVPVDMLSLNIDNILEFREWYNEQDTFNYGDADYLPRYVFGHYMKSYLEQFDHEFDNVNVIKKEVKHMYIEEQANEIIPKRIIVCTDDEVESCKDYDYVFFTIGTMSYHDPYQLKGQKGYIQAPYPANQTLSEVKKDDTIAMIGTGLASLDVIRYTLSHHQKKPIIMASRGGKLPSVRGEMQSIEFKYLTFENFDQLKAENMGVVPLEDAVELFKKECEVREIPLQKLLKRRKYDAIRDLNYDLNHPEELGALQSVFEALKENMDWIWNSLSREDQTQFISKYHRYLKENTNPMPRETALLLIDAIKAGDLEILSGLENVRQYYGKYRLAFKNKEDELKVDIVINATGPKKHLSQLDDDDALLLDVADREIIQPHPMGGIQIVPSTNEVISPLYGTLRNLRAIGQITNGVNFERNGVTMIVQQAVRAVDNLYDTYKAKKALDKEKKKAQKKAQKKKKDKNKKKKK